jgi:hypothetical protein
MQMILEQVIRQFNADATGAWHFHPLTIFCFSPSSILYILEGYIHGWAAFSPARVERFLFMSMSVLLLCLNRGHGRREIDQGVYLSTVLDTDGGGGKGKAIDITTQVRHLVHLLSRLHRGTWHLQEYFDFHTFFLFFCFKQMSEWDRVRMTSRICLALIGSIAV